MPVFLLQFVVLAILLPLALFVPGFFFVRRMRLSPAEKLCVSVGLSGILIYLFHGTVFVLKAPLWVSYFGTAAAIAAAVWCRRDISRLLTVRRVRGGVMVMGLMLAWGLLLTAMVRHYGGGGWAGDWYEHFERTKFFLHEVPWDRKFLELYRLPSRPPMQNVVGAFFMAQTGDSFPAFQVLFLFLGMLAVLPCWLIAPAMVRRARVTVPVFVGIFATCPMLAQNVTWTWTKLWAAGYVVLAIALYLAAWRKNDSRRMTMAFVSLAAGCLVHYSAVGFALVIAAHYGLTTLARQRWAVKEWAVTTVLCLALLGTWFVSSVVVYGPIATVGETTTAGGFQGLGFGPKLIVMGQNLVNTLIPYPLRGVGPQWPRQGVWGLLRDTGFDIYQPNFTPAMGILGWVVALWAMVRQFRLGGDGRRSVERWFWPAFVIGGYVLGVAVHPPPVDRFGVAHVGLQPLAMLGVTLVAAAFAQLPRWLQIVVALSRLVDFAWGILLHFTLNSTAFVTFKMRDQVGVSNPLQLSDRSGLNWMAKSENNLSYIGDALAPMLMVLRVLCGLMGAALVAALLWPTRGKTRGVAAGGPAYTHPRSPAGPEPIAGGWSRQTVFSTPWFELVGKSAPGAAAGDKPHYSIATEDYVVVLAVTDDGKLPMVRQYRPAVERVTLELPAGHVTRGEDPATAARRELAEETGYLAGKVELIGELMPDSARLGNRLWCFMATGLRLDKTAKPDEGVEPLVMTVEQLRAAMHDGRFNHALQIAALLMAVEQGKLTSRWEPRNPL